jgi:hypothetical protein
MFDDWHYTMHSGAIERIPIKDRYRKMPQAQIAADLRGRQGQRAHEL